MSRKRFVVGVDGSAGSRRALRWAIDEAATWDADLDVVHAWQQPAMVVPPVIFPPTPDVLSGLREGAEKLLHSEVEAALPGTPARPHAISQLAIEGPAAATLLEVAKGADLLIVGSRGHGGFTGLLLGSVSGHCMHHAQCPVAVIKGDGVTVDHQPPIVVGVDGSSGSLEALCWALDEAARTGSPVVAVAAWSWLDQPEGQPFDVHYGEPDVWAAVERAIATARQRVPAAGAVSVEIRAINDHPARALIDASHGARLLVVGRRGLGAFRAALVGSVSQHCVHHASSSVVVVEHWAPREAVTGAPAAG